MNKETKQLHTEKDHITDVYITVSCTLVRIVDYKQAIGCEIHQGKFSAKRQNLTVAKQIAEKTPKDRMKILMCPFS